MLQNVRPVAVRYETDFEPAPQGEGIIDFDRLLAAAKRQWRLAALLACLGAALGVAYVLTAVPLYTATTDLLIDQGANRIVDELSTSGGATALEDEATILSQVELLRSSQISLKVVDDLRLVDDAAFMASSASPIAQAKALLRRGLDVSSWFQSEDAEQPGPDNRRQGAAAMLSRNLDVARQGRSYVLRIAYTSPDPQMSARIARSFAETYLTDQLDSKYEATRRASGWLQQRIAELRERSLESDLAVQKFKADNGLITADGRLVSDQQLTELNTQLTAAQAEVASAKAKSDRIEVVIRSGDTNAVVNDALASTTINELRTKFLDASKREAEISSRLGTSHAQAVRLRGEMENYRRLMFGELSRIADSYRNDLNVAQAREASVQASVAAATSVSAGANDAQVQLREFEREAETYRNLYQTFLQRYQEAVQQQSFPITEARVITQAEAPRDPSRPQKTVTVALMTFLGLAAGVGLGAFREFRDRFFRSGEQVRDELGQEYLGAVPIVKSVPLKAAGSRKNRQTEVPAGEERFIRPSQSVSRYVVDHPFSSFAETLRGAKVAANLSLSEERPKVIGIVSVLPGEGKSTISINLAQLFASQDAKTLLIDGDLRNPGLTRAIGAHAKSGLVDVVVRGEAWQNVTLQDPQTQLAFVPAALHQRVSHTADLLASPRMAAVLKQVSDAFDYVLVDLPPLGPVVDVRAMAARIDGFVLVVEWGKTARRVVRATLASNPEIARKCLGVVLNKVDENKMKLYQEFGSGEYYSSRYRSYYHTDA